MMEEVRHDDLFRVYRKADVPIFINEKGEEEQDFETEEELYRMIDERYCMKDPSNEDVKRMNRVRLSATNLLEQMEDNCPPGRELSLAMSKLDECVMWATKAILKKPKRSDDRLA